MKLYPTPFKLNSSDDENEKTNIVRQNTGTFNDKVKAANEAPPALVVLMGPPGYMGKQWSMTHSELIIGRSVDCLVYIDDKSVSRNHARLNVSGSDVSIIDLDSSNKTFINGKQLTPMTPYKLKNNDQLKTGNIIMKFLEKGNIEAITNMELNEKVQKDILTGAYSKAALLERGPEVIKRSDVLNEELTLLVFDIDHFKKVNDTYGHAGGDFVLKELGKVINTKLVRAQDYFARFGGEEFVIILTATPLKTAIEVAERIRTTIESTQFDYEDQLIPVTISIGVASRKANQGDWETLFELADQAVYQSKQTGRNKVTAAAI